jgi:hypothetical protein
MGAERGIGKGRRFGRGRFEIESVSWVDAEGLEKPVYDGEKKVLSNSFKPLTVNDLCVNRDTLSANSHLLSVRYLTPTRITFDHQLHTYPEFHVVIRNLLRRLSNLAYFHCGQELKLDFRPSSRQPSKLRRETAKCNGATGSDTRQDRIRR